MISCAIRVWDHCSVVLWKRQALASALCEADPLFTLFRPRTSAPVPNNNNPDGNTGILNCRCSKSPEGGLPTAHPVSTYQGHHICGFRCHWGKRMNGRVWEIWKPGEARSTICEKGRGTEGEAKETHFWKHRSFDRNLPPFPLLFPSVLEKCKCARVPRWLAGG